MRFVAAALVLCTHATFYYHERIDAAIQVWHFGEVGVPIFFVISGIVMVVATQSLPNDGAGARLFMLRRVVRIVPLWWAALSIKVFVSLVRPDAVNHNFFQIDHALKSYFFIPYFNEQHAVEPLHGVGWTLLHEMFFYTLFSLAMWLGLRPGVTASATIVGLCFAGKLVALDSPFWSVATSPANLYFVVGMVVGSVMVRGPGWRRIRWGATASLALLTVVLASLPSRWGVHHSIPVALAVAVCILLWSRSAMPQPLAALGRLGNSSYSLYLFHPFVAPAALLALGRVMPGIDAWLHITAAVLFTVLVAHLLHLWLEVPVVRWARDRLMQPIQTSKQSGAQTA